MWEELWEAETQLWEAQLMGRKEQIHLFISAYPPDTGLYGLLKSHPNSPRHQYPLCRMRKISHYEYRLSGGLKGSHFLKSSFLSHSWNGNLANFT
jgi:hypothetical protein